MVKCLHHGWVQNLGVRDLTLEEGSPCRSNVFIMAGSRILGSEMLSIWVKHLTLGDRSLGENSFVWENCLQAWLPVQCVPCSAGHQLLLQTPHTSTGEKRKEKKRSQQNHKNVNLKQKCVCICKYQNLQFAF